MDDHRVVHAVNQSLGIKLRSANNDGLFLHHMQDAVARDGHNVERLKESLRWVAGYWFVNAEAVDKIEEWVP